MNKRVSKFVKPGVIRAFKETGQPLSNLDISLDNQNSNNNLVIGFTTCEKLKKLLQEDINERTLDEFLSAAQSFSETTYNYCRKWLPLNYPFFKHCQFVNFGKRLEYGIEEIMQIITMMAHLHGKLQVDVSLVDQLDIKEESYCIKECQIMKFHNVPGMKPLFMKKKQQHTIEWTLSGHISISCFLY